MNFQGSIQLENWFIFYFINVIIIILKIQLNFVQTSLK